MPLKDIEKVRKIHRLRDEIRTVSVRIGRKAFLEIEQDPEDYVVLRGSVEALIEEVGGNDV
jgi:hypothetical protein